ncbi:MAG: ATP-grasp domain-containing protein [Pseudomonadota bacterium]
MGHNRHVIVAGRVARMMAAAARAAGYMPLVIDSFGDVDTLKIAADHKTLRYVGEQIDFLHFEQQLAHFASHHAEALPLCWTSGWEASAHVLCALATRWPILGSHPRALFRLADPKFARDMPQQEFLPNGDAVQTAASLIKTRAASGGHHVRYRKDEIFLSAAEFFQPYVHGVSLSNVCFANETAVHVLGWNQHVALQESPAAPFRQSGAVAIEAPEVSPKLRPFLQVLAKNLGLAGVFGCDFIQLEDGGLKLVDVNPRPTASAPLHVPLEKLFTLHANPRVFGAPEIDRGDVLFTGTAVIYAEVPIVIPKTLHWPSWVSDIPRCDEAIQAGQPICTIWADQWPAAAAKEQLRERQYKLLALVSK